MARLAPPKRSPNSVGVSPYKEAMATRNLSLEEILEEKPTLDELCEHIRIGSKWYQLGIQLKLNAKKLEDIHKLSDDSTYKTTKMFELWLDTKPDATRRQVVDALRKEEITVAHEYEQTLWKSSSLPTSKYKEPFTCTSSYKSYITSLFMDCVLFLL